MFLRIFIHILCIGFCRACMTHTLCKEFDDAANAASSDMVAYCPLLSQTIACFAGEGCSDSILAPLYTKYYSMCDLTADDVNTCKVNTAGCTELKENAESSLPGDLKNYCSMMASYKECIDAIVPTICSDTKVTSFDVFGEDYGKYEITCRNTSFIECQAQMNSAGCSFYVNTASEALGNRDFSSLCSSLNLYKSCTDTAFLNCDQLLTKSVFLQGYDSQLQHYCNPAATECQGMVNTNCSSLLDSTAIPLCGKMTAYLECVTQTMKTCNASVMEDSVIGSFRVNYIFQCGPQGTDECPAITTCMTSIQQDNKPTSGAPNILQECGKSGQLLSCMDTEFAKCGRSSPRPYTYTDVSRLYVRSCQTMANQTGLLTCDAMTVCMSNLDLPSDQVELAKLYYDPEFWCRLLKMAIDCGSQLTQECEASSSIMSSLLTDTNALCYPAGTNPSTEPNSSSGPTSQSPNEQTTGPVSRGYKTGAGSLSYMAVLLVILVQLLR